ncbi:hypothetical protein [Teredinibacter purpureus]|uniref:hypothetical protein n=2 Tax=Teredinibacter purpureus TaxID=2731756 RepID=UPI0005F77217|nr:hypothetical protein [Teredinibacter purpureus]
MKISLIIFVLALSGCSCLSKIEQEEPEGELFISMMMVEGAFSGPIKGKTGFAFYIEQPRNVNTIGPFLNGYRYIDGKLVEVFDHGSSARDYIAKIEDLDFKPFDYEVELEKAVKKAQNDYEIVVLGVRDGAKWELKINTPYGMFVLNKWNPGGEIEFLAPYNENFSKLNAIIEALANYYGSYHLHM